MYYRLIIIPVISAFIGYITNVLAIKMLFWPKKPINFGLFQLYGVLPKRQADIARNIGELVENHLLSWDDLFAEVNTPRLQDKLITSVTVIIKNKLSSILPRVLPGKIVELIGDSIEKIMRQEAPGVINQFVNVQRDSITREIQIRNIVETRVREFNLDELEAMIRGVSSTELRFIEIMGGALGFIIGIIQVIMLAVFPE
ncbi:MAG: DUF445 domain-containing protein [Syntrophomonadaceae bacterium]|jgi:uncharacterized membrane protein YheB (UPF0754 family)